MSASELEAAYTNARNSLMSRFDTLSKTAYRPDLIAQEDGVDAVDGYLSEWIQLNEEIGSAIGTIAMIADRLQAPMDISPLSNLIADEKGIHDRNAVKNANRCLFQIDMPMQNALQKYDEQSATSGELSADPSHVPTGKNWPTASEVATAIEISKPRLTQLTQAGKVAHYRDGKNLRVDANDVVRHKNENDEK